jgi:N-acetyl-anhydromuramyl-L-alanine amidase AmpD
MSLNISKSLTLPDDQFFHNGSKKTGIVLHHTVGGTASSTLNWWKTDNQMVGTAYLIGRDGKVYEVFDPKGWAWQFGLKWLKEEKIKFEKRFIGIEIASEGGLTESGGNLYCFDHISDRTKKNKSEAFDYGKDYRGYRYFDKYETAQIDSVIELVNHLCQTFNITKNLPKNYLEYYGKKLIDFEGIIGHTMVRSDKSDPVPDKSFWKRIIKECSLTQLEINNNQESKIVNMNEEDNNKLFEHNMKELNKMYVPAGSMIKGLIMELARDERNTFIKLRDAESGGHIVYYDFVQGDPGLVYRLGIALGLKLVTEDKLEVKNA